MIRVLCISVFQQILQQQEVALEESEHNIIGIDKPEFVALAE